MREKYIRISPLPSKAAKSLVAKQSRRWCLQLLTGLNRSEIVRVANGARSNALWQRHRHRGLLLGREGGRDTRGWLVCGLARHLGLFYNCIARS
jgi:hypothetical protein